MDSGAFGVVCRETLGAELRSGTTRVACREGRPREDEARLVAGLVSNEAHAWREFQRRYGGLIFRCIGKTTRRFAAVSTCDVRDIHAQLLVSLLANDRAKLRAFDPSRGSRFSTYIGMLATHCAYDYLRYVRREPRHEELSEASALVSVEADPYEKAVQEERAALASRMLASFSARDRVFAALYFGEGMRPTEIARAMNISLKTVYSKKHKIKSKLEDLVSRVKEHPGARFAS